MKRILENKVLLSWAILFGFSFFGVVFMISVSMTQHPISSSDRFGVPWEEKLITPFYFTFISNAFAMITSLIVLLGRFKSNNHQMRLKLLMATSLTITLIVYWTLLGRKSIPHQTPILLTSNVLVHAITPVLAISVFIYDSKKGNNKEGVKIKDLLIIFIFPLTWLFFAISFYYGMGGAKKDAIYAFLAFEQNAWYWSVMYVVVIAISYFGFSFMYAKIFQKLQPA